MRILMLPLIGLSNVASDSDYLIYRDLIELSNKKGLKNFFYLILPKTAEGKVEELPNSKNFYFEMSPDFFAESMSVPKEVISLFSRREGMKITIDWYRKNLELLEKDKTNLW